MSTPESIEVPSPPTKLVTFHRLIPNARLPQRADRSAAGTLPTRAYRYCEPATTASVMPCRHSSDLERQSDGGFALSARCAR